MSPTDEKKGRYGYRLETVLRRFGYTRFQPSYVDAGALNENIMHSRKFAQRAIERKLRTKNFRVMLLKNDEAARLCTQAMKLDAETDDGYCRFVDLMEEVVRLLKLPPPAL